MSYVEILRERRKTPVSAWHKLRTSLETQKFDFYAAFEGEEDEEFYSGFLAERFSGKKFRPIICDGKGGVLALYGEVVAKYGNPRNVFFFLDSDHDRFLGVDEYPAQTFVTCGYSVENYLYDTDLVISGVKKYFQLNSADELCNEIRTAFESDCQVFEARAISLMSYAVALRAHDQNPKLDKIDLNTVFLVEDDGLRRRRIDCVALLDAAEVEPLPSSEVFRHARMLRGSDPNSFIRGKFVAQFVVNFCRRIAKRFANKQKLNGRPLKAKIEFGKKNFVSTFVDFVELPGRLNEFLEEIEEIVGRT